MRLHWKIVLILTAILIFAFSVTVNQLSYRDPSQRHVVSEFPSTGVVSKELLRNLWCLDVPCSTEAVVTEDRFFGGAAGTISSVTGLETTAPFQSAFHSAGVPRHHHLW